MLVERHAPRTFLKRTASLIAGAEAENHLIHVLARRLESGDLTLNAPPVLATVSDAEGPLLAGLRTPPGNLIVSTGPLEAAHALADGLKELGVSLPGVAGPKSTAEAFATRWSNERELVYLARARACSRIEAISEAPGTLRLASEAETDVVASWVEAFHVKIVRDASDAHRFAKRRIAQKVVFVWDDGGPVSMACIDGETPAGVRVDWIFTPEQHRGKGYAKSCIAAVTRRMLEGGRRFCLSHAVTADARANALLEGLGYHAVGIHATWRFLAGSVD